MELRELRYFAAVVEAGSLTAAAERLRLSQPSLSVAIGRLETELGVRLLTRSSRGVEVTGPGQYLLESSTRLLGDADEIVRTLGRFASGVVGSLTMAAVPVLMWRRLPRLLRAFAQEAPEVEVKLVDPPPWTAMDMVRQGRADLAAILVSDPSAFAKRHGGDFQIIDWGEVPLVAALPKQEAPERGAPLPLSYFAGRPLLVPRRSAAVPSLPEAIDATLRLHGVVPAALRTVDTIQAGLPLIEAGTAMAILPDPERESLGRFDISVHPLNPVPEPLRALVLIRREGRRDAVLGRLLAQISIRT